MKWDHLDAPERFFFVSAGAMVVGIVMFLTVSATRNNRLMAQCIAERGAAKEYECDGILRGCGGISQTFVPAPVTARR